MPPFIRCIGLKKYFNMGTTTVRAVDGVDLDIEPGSFTVIMGPSGSGKSTLLYLLGGLDRPTAGEIYVNNHRLDLMDENALARYRRRSVGFIYQSFNLIHSMTAKDNVSFPMQFANIPIRNRNERALSLLERVGLKDRSTHRPAELSGGQQQRVAIARALVNDPQIILADEPTGNLDTSSGMGILELLSELHKSGRTIIVVTHDLRMAHFSTDILYLLDGRFVTEEEYQQASLFKLAALE